MAKRPYDPVQLAKPVFDIAIGEAEERQSCRYGCDPCRALQFCQNPQHAEDHAWMAAGLSDHVWTLEEIPLLAN